MADLRKRIDVLCKALRGRNLDAFVTSFLPHVRYLTGFSGSNGVCIVTHENVFFLTDFRYREQVRTEVTAGRVVVGSGKLVERAAREGLLRGCKRIGCEKDYLPYGEFLDLQKNFKTSRVFPVVGIVEKIASVKDEVEISLIRRAASISDSVFSKVLRMIKPGISELEISAEVSYLHKMYGAEGDAFEIIVVSGERGALPHGRATSRKIRRGDLVTLDFGCIYGGYCSDLTRTVAVGRVSAEARRVYRIVSDAQRRAIEEARSDITGKKLDAVARRFIREKGFGRYFGHSLGHGIGLQVHELPRVSMKSDDTLVTGNVIAVEPGIYLPGKFGVRIEDDVVIRDGTRELLTGAPRELLVL